MSKEIEHKLCKFCDSDYKLSYKLEDVSGHPKFCPFCGNEAYNEDDEISDLATVDDE